MVAITDHDIVTVIKTRKQVVSKRALTIISAAEMSGTHEGEEFHLLVYFSDEAPPEFLKLCESQQHHRTERVKETVRRIGNPPLPFLDKLVEGGSISLTRHHIARALVSANLCPDYQAAFRTYLSHSLGNVPPIPTHFTEIITHSRALGALTVWAHPPNDALDKHLHSFVDAGLQGLEAMRPHHSRPFTDKLKRLAREHNLIITGGSDWHGWGRGDVGKFAVSRKDVSGFIGALRESA